MAKLPQSAPVAVGLIQLVASPQRRNCGRDISREVNRRAGCSLTIAPHGGPKPYAPRLVALGRNSSLLTPHSSLLHECAPTGYAPERSPGGLRAPRRGFRRASLPDQTNHTASISWAARAPFL
jgi:hypothetical protein